MRMLAVTMVSLALLGCSKTEAPDPNAAFVDALLEKHLTPPTGSESRGMPKAVAESVRNCARPGMLVAAKQLSEADKAEILKTTAQSIDDPEATMPDPELMARAQGVNSVLAGCAGAAMMQERSAN